MYDTITTFDHRFELPHMKAHITLNKREYIRDIPISWDQVTFGDFLKLEACGQDIVKVIALLTRLDYETLCQAKIKNMDQVVSILGFLNKPMPKQDPSTIKSILGYPVPKGLEFEQVQMFVDLKNYVTESQKLTPAEQLERYTLYCAVYACSHKHGKYDWKLAEEMKDEFLNAPCTEVLAIGNFTLLRLIGLNLNINLNSLKAGSRIKRFRLAFKGWVLLTVHFFQSLISKKGLAIKKMKS